MGVIKYRNNEGKIEELLAIKGDKGDKGDKGEKGNTFVVEMDGTNDEHRMVLNMGEALDGIIHDYSFIMLQVQIDGSTFGGDYESYPTYDNIFDVIAIKAPHYEEWGEDEGTEFVGKQSVFIRNHTNDKLEPAIVFVDFFVSRDGNITYSEMDTGAIVDVGEGEGNAKIVGMYLIA